MRKIGNEVKLPEFGMRNLRIISLVVAVLICSVMVRGDRQNVKTSKQNIGSGKDDYANTEHLFAKVPEPPKTPEIPASQTYVIDLKKFGITKGFLKKGKHDIDGKKMVCYSDKDYQVAYNNMMGLNKAIEFGAKRGSKKILIPKGNYSFCYANNDRDPKKNHIVIDFDNLIVDFNGSTWKAIFDSHRRSPYDKTLTGDWRKNVWVPNTKRKPYKMGGSFLAVSDCQNTSVRNGIVIGDKVERAFSEQVEKSMEHTYGVGAGGNCKNVVVENFDVSFFMGDGVTCSRGYRNKAVEVGYQMGWKTGGLSTKGLSEPNPKKCTSGFLNVAAGESYFMQGYGYTQGMTAIKKRAYDVFVYDANRNFVAALGTVKVLRTFTVPKGGASARLVVGEPVVHKDGWQMQLKSGIYGSHVTFRDNYVHHNHRGGMTIGVNDMLITRNRFYNNGEYPDKENNLPGFEQPKGSPFMTRYHINMEDSQGHNIHIVNNRFENGRLGVAVRGSEFCIESNTFINNLTVFYRLQNLVLKNNTFTNGGIDTFPYNHNGWFVRNWIIDGNKIDGAIQISGDAPVRSIINNTIGKGFSSAASTKTCKNNTFLLNKDKGFSTLLALATMPIVEDCRFIKDEKCKAKNVIYLGSILKKKEKGKAEKPATRMEFRTCVFERIKTGVGNVDFISCTFTDAGLTTKTELSFRDCTFTQGEYKLLNNYGGHPDNTALIYLNKGTTKLSFKGCKITADGPHRIFASHNNQALPVDVDLIKTKITRKGTGDVGLEIFGGTISLTDSQIESEQPLAPLKQKPTLVRSTIGNEAE